MARQTNAMITFNDARYMVANENFTAKQTIPSSNECMTKSEIDTYLLYESVISDYANNQLVPYHRLSPHFWQFITSYYRMEEKSGNLIDSKLGRNISGGEGLVRGISGKLGYGVDVRQAGFGIGNSGFYDFSENGLSRSVSFVTWVKYLGAGSFVIFSNSLNSVRWSFRFETIGNDLIMRIKGGDSEIVDGNYIGRKVTNFDFKINQWQLLGFSYSGGSDSSALRIYQNAVRVDNSDMSVGTYGNALNTPTSVKFFYWKNGTSGDAIHLNGYADEVMFLRDFSMKINDFRYLYNNGAGRILTPPTI